MATHFTTAVLNEALRNSEISTLPSDYLITDLSPEHPVWSFNLPDGPFPVYCLAIGERVLCPARPTAPHSARTIGMDGEACGVVCDDCKTVYTARKLPSNRHVDAKHPGQSLSYPDTFVCTEDVTAFMPPGYKLYYMESDYPVWAAEFKEGPLSRASYGVGKQVLCPTHLTQHAPARTIGDEIALGIVCDECKAVYAGFQIVPSWMMETISCIPHHRHEKVIFQSVTVRRKSREDSDK